MWCDGIDYTPITSFWDDFSIAEPFGEDAIIDTANRAFKEWKDNYKYLTELIMVINHKSWYWHSRNNDDLSLFYADLYYKYDEMAIEHLEKNRPEEELTYYFKTLD